MTDTRGVVISLCVMHLYLQATKVAKEVIFDSCSQTKSLNVIHGIDTSLENTNEIFWKNHVLKCHTLVFLNHVEMFTDMLNKK